MLFLSGIFRHPRRRPPATLTNSVKARVCARPFIVLLGFTAIILAGGIGCTARSDEPGNGSPDPGDPDPTDEETIAFVPAGMLTLAPSELTSLTVEVSPPRRQNVTFELLTETVGFDGFLLSSEVRVLDDGTARVDLQAPSGPALFTVRASLPEGARAVRSISINAQGYGSIDVIPSYDGARVIPQWTASARVNETCEALETYFEDGQLVSTGATRVAITDVPSGVPIAVTIRGGQLAAGCATLTALRADDLEEVEIEVNDHPVDVSNGTLSMQLGIDSSTAVFASHFNQAIDAGSSSFRADSANDAAALLSHMSSELGGADQEDFESAISTHQLENVVQSLYAEEAPITQVVSSLLNDAASEITGPDVFRGQLTLQGASSQFLLTEAVGVEASASGFFQGSTWMVSSESGDMVVLGGTLSYEPLRWLKAIADSRSEEGPSPEERILEAANCAAVAEAITAAVGSPPFDECDESCLDELCQDSVASVWDIVPDQDSALTTLQLGISGRAGLYGSAKIESLTGSWVGRLGTEDETSVGGIAEAELFIEE